MMQAITNRHLRLSLILICTITAACTSNQEQTTPTPQVADTSLLTQSTCVDLPCWQGLILGKSTLDEAILFAKSNKLIDGNYNDPPGQMGFIWWWAGRAQELEHANQFLFVDGTLAEIHLKPNTNITLRNLINANGAPDKTIIAGRCYDNGGTPGYDLKAFYSRLGAVISWEYADNTVPVCPPPMTICPNLDQAASEIDYYTAEMIEEQQSYYQVGFSTTSNHGWNVYNSDIYSQAGDNDWTIKCTLID